MMTPPADHLRPRLSLLLLGVLAVSQTVAAQTARQPDGFVEAQFVVSLDSKTGKTIWEYNYAAPYLPKMDMSYGDGPHSTPLVAENRVYTVGPDGTRARVRALQPDAHHPREYLSTSPDATKTNNLLTLPRFYG